MTGQAWLSEARREFHSSILASLLTRSSTGIPSNADSGSAHSIAIANGILDQLGNAVTADKLPGQTAGSDFEEICAAYVRVCFERLTHLRPGTFNIRKGGGIASFDQYQHLDDELF